MPVTTIIDETSAIRAVLVARTIAQRPSSHKISRVLKSHLKSALRHDPGSMPSCSTDSTRTGTWKAHVWSHGGGHIVCSDQQLKMIELLGLQQIPRRDILKLMWQFLARCMLHSSFPRNRRTIMPMDEVSKFVTIAPDGGASTGPKSVMTPCWMK